MYEFEKLIPRIKELVIPTIIESLETSPINDEIPNSIMSEVIFSHLLALTYNDEDINATLSDLMPFRNPAIYSGSDEEDAVKMSMILVGVLEDFKFQYMAIKGAMNDLIEEVPEKDLIINIKKLLFHA